MNRLILLPLVVLVTSCGTPAEEGGDPRQVEDFPRCANTDSLKKPLFGDLHVHTMLSLDASLQGVRVRPDDAYRFAKGEAIDAPPYDPEGKALRSIRIDRPLDFAAVTDHAEFLGTVATCNDADAPGYDHRNCVTYRDNQQLAFTSINGLTAAAQGNTRWPAVCGEDGADCRDAGLDAWGEITDAAEAHYDRTDTCGFTSLVGYEWSGGPNTLNLHRNVIFRSEAVPDWPVGYFDESFESGLWDRLTSDCLDDAPCDVLAIPHNSNISSGIMFRTPDDGIAPLTAEEAEKRVALEPLVEIFQHKGDSECWPGSPAADELCGFEKIPYNSLSGSNLDVQGTPVARDFVRDILGVGLAYSDAIGVNPYRLGIIASTDTHLGAPGLALESDYPGHGGAGQNNATELPPGLPDLVTFNPGGLAVVWAEENTREAIFRALKRRETYGTSGPRIVLRTFAGDEVPEGMCDDANFAQTGADAGVPMGGQLPAGTGAPRFAIRALADVGSDDRALVNLDKVQVIKGSFVNGEVVTEIFDVASGAPVDPIDTTTCAVPAGGAAELCGVWTDPSFDPNVPAFWYVRVVEVPTCRWHTLQCNAEGITCPASGDFAACCDDRVEDTVQERAWSSPVWYEPG